MLKITIDGVTYEVAPQVSEALVKERKITADMLEALKTDGAKVKSELDKATARADALETEKKGLAESLAKATAPDSIRQAVIERVALETVATKHEVKADGLDNMGIRRAVISKIDPNVKLDGKTDDYVIGMFDHVTRAPAATAIGKLTGDASSTVKAEEISKTSAERRAAYNATFFKSSAAK